MPIWYEEHSRLNCITESLPMDQYHNKKKHELQIIAVLWKDTKSFKERRRYDMASYLAH